MYRLVRIPLVTQVTYEIDGQELNSSLYMIERTGESIFVRGDASFELIHQQDQQRIINFFASRSIGGFPLETNNFEQFSKLHLPSQQPITIHAK